jgi:hypothetical protein
VSCSRRCRTASEERMMSNSFDDFVDDTGNIVIREDLTLVRHV